MESNAVSENFRSEANENTSLEIPQKLLNAVWKIEFTNEIGADGQ